MLRFAKALIGHKLLGPALTDTVLTGKVKIARPGGPPDDKYEYGFRDQKVNGVRIVGHNRARPGFGAQLDIYPDHNYIVIILTNKDWVFVPARLRSEQILTR